MLMRTPPRWVRPKRQLPPGFIVPCQPILARAVPAGDGWLHELKHDGYRIIQKALRKAGPELRFSEHMVASDVEAMFQHACAMGLEGTSRSASSPATSRARA
jgi:ATP-dependent DNA ligase